MNKRTLLLFIIPLVICLAGTYFLLTLSRTGGNSGSFSPINGQTNFLILTVDSLQSDQPALLSAWILFIRPEDPAFLMFKRIYPDGGDTTGNSNLTDTFKLTDDGTPTEAFLAQIARYKINQDSYFMLDSTGLAILYSGYTGNDLANDAGTPPADETVLLDLCSRVNISRQETDQKVIWNQLIPAHMRTNLSFETFATLWEKLTGVSAPPHCEIIDLSAQTQPEP